MPLFHEGRLLVSTQFIGARLLELSVRGEVATAREVWLLPTPVLEAQTATTGSFDSIMVRVALGSSKPAPRAFTRAARWPIHISGR